MDYSELKKNYPFLGTILTYYNKLEEPAVIDDQYQIVLNLCDKPNTFTTKLTTEQKITCKKLLRNLLLCSRLDRDEIMNCCGNLYVWLYFEIKKYEISNDIIKKIFELPMSEENEGPKYFPCPYVTFHEQIHNPEDLMKLSIFNDNVVTFKTMLMGSDTSNNCYLKKFIYKCVDIYNNNNEAYTSFLDCDHSPYKYACDIITTFNTMYTTHILNKAEITHVFPKLSSNTPLNVIDGCTFEDIKPDTPSEQKQQVTPATRGATTALSAMAGIPPFLILMYKFTPIRNLFRFGNKNNTIITSNFDKKMENELFHVIKEDSNIKDIQPKYNIGYEPK